MSFNNSFNKVKHELSISFDVSISMFQKVRSEIEKGDVAAVSFVVGSSVVTSKEFFSINFPHDYAVAGSDAGNDRHVLLQFFR